MDNLDIVASVNNKAMKWHSDSELASSDSNRTKSSETNFNANKKSSKQKTFIPKDHLWSRANSLKKAMREIIDHTEKGTQFLFSSIFLKAVFFFLLLSEKTLKLPFGL